MNWSHYEVRQEIQIFEGDLIVARVPLRQHRLREDRENAADICRRRNEANENMEQVKV